MALLSLPSIPPGADVFVDANVFLYHFHGTSIQCTNFLSRCAREEICGVTNFEVVAEVVHRAMMAEAIAGGVIPRARAADLRGLPEAIRRLSSYWTSASRIFSMNLLLLESGEDRHRLAQDLRRTHGLMTNDSLIAAAMKSYGVRSIATRDGDFERVVEFDVYRPDDIQLGAL